MASLLKFPIRFFGNEEEAVVDVEDENETNNLNDDASRDQSNQAEMDNSNNETETLRSANDKETVKKRKELKKEIIHNNKSGCYIVIFLSSFVNLFFLADLSFTDILELVGSQPLAPDDVEVEMTSAPSIAPSISPVHISPTQVEIYGMKSVVNYEIMFGSISCLLTFLILIFDYFRYLHQKFDFEKVLDGKLECGSLIFLILWWLVGTGIMTSAGGVAYRVLNTYFSCWLCLYMSVYTFNEWLAENDILSWKELTSLSLTLPYWFIVFIISIIEFGTAGDVLVKLKRFTKNDSKERTPLGKLDEIDKATYAISVGAISCMFAFLAIMIHYEFCFRRIKRGGAIEIVVAMIQTLWWVVACLSLTSGKEIAGSVQGCEKLLNDDGDILLLGNNLYFSLWLGLYASSQIVLKWKAQKAIDIMIEDLPNEEHLEQTNVEGSGL